MPETETRRRLIKAFKAGGVGLKITKGHGKNKREFMVYPKIHRVTVSLERRQVVFTLPLGLNPKEIFEHDWLLQQAFGEHIEVDGDVKNFALNIYNEGLKQYKYDLEEAKKACEGMHLPVYVGKSRTGLVAYDMTLHPHLLEAGETGSGKSVALRSILTTMLLVAGNRMKLYCGDLKRSEFHLFRGIAAEVCTDEVKLLHILQRVQAQLIKRGELCDKEGVEGILELPEEIRPEFIVVAIDEVVLIKDNEACMKIIDRIGAIGRSLGVFLILAMQRPDREVVEGRLKSNMTVRMAFRHADEINSRITIGTGEAADIKHSEKGLMIHKLDGIKRVQAPLLKTDACRKLLAHLKKGDNVTPPPAASKRKKGSGTPEEVKPEELQEIDNEGFEPLEGLDDENA
jgi:S-DNA-T family DNA segregation ATPase FtsK/SpoIIIE